MQKSNNKNVNWRRLIISIIYPTWIFIVSLFVLMAEIYEYFPTIQSDDAKYDRKYQRKLCRVDANRGVVWKGGRSKYLISSYIAIDSGESYDECLCGFFFLPLYASASIFSITEENCSAHQRENCLSLLLAFVC